MGREGKQRGRRKEGREREGKGGKRK